jgi:hypothetical protein
MLDEQRVSKKQVGLAFSIWLLWKTERRRCLMIFKKMLYCSLYNGRNSASPKNSRDIEAVEPSG